jgi:hypothetical protein
MFIVDDLKTKLEKFLSTIIVIDNCSRIYKYSSIYNYDKLKKICLSFIKENYDQVVETKDFEELQSEFLVEVIRYCK